MTLAHLAGGRLDLGVGAGADGPDATVLGEEEMTPRERTDRFHDWVELLITLLEHQAVTATAGQPREGGAGRPPRSWPRGPMPQSTPA
jgi:alkanesulfonate monooxygenase SsuD/methylene tetrahydromethanopterin reductase-like flavin-dependent oxidoreductase (luciferase family)